LPGEQLVRPVIALALLAAVLAAGCAITSSTAAPAVPAPTITPGEQPARVVAVAGAGAAAPLMLRIYDRSLALGEVRTATPAELASIEPLPSNAVGVFQTKVGDVLLTWTDTGCNAADGDMFIGPGVSEIVVVPGSAPSCGTAQTVRGVYLHFDPTVDPKRVSFSVAASPAG
jgi:hypothetical protein